MLKSERGNQQKRQKRKPPRELRNQLTTAFCGLFCLQGGRIGGGAFISQRFYAGEEFLHRREKTKIKRFTVFCGIRHVCGRTM